MCVPSIYCWFSSRAPGNESLVHTPTFGASDDLIMPTTALTVRYILDLPNVQARSAGYRARTQIISRLPASNETWSGHTVLRPALRA